MKGRFPFKILAKYPHLRPEDVAIWEKFIRLHPGYFERVDYDVKVGKGREYPDVSEKNIKKDLEYLSKKRIDAVAFKDDITFVIEIKPKAGLKALGQARGYADLFKETVSRDQRVLPLIITDEEIPDMKELSRKMGVSYLIV